MRSPTGRRALLPRNHRRDTPWMDQAPTTPPADETRVPFWIVLTGVGVGAAWALIGVAVGHWISRHR